jgi:hypothetical protein
MASGAQKPLAVGNSIIAAFNFPNTRRALALCQVFQSVPTKIRQRLPLLYGRHCAKRHAAH